LSSSSPEVSAVSGDGVDGAFSLSSSSEVSAVGEDGVDTVFSSSSSSEVEGCPILSSRFHRKKGSYESLDSSNGEFLLTICQVELSIGKVHLIRGI